MKGKEKLMEIPIDKIRFIKLGSKQDKKEDDCLENAKMILGYREINHFENNNNLNLEDLKNEFINKHQTEKGAATRHAIQIMNFYDSSETTLWITFAKRKVWWGFAENSEPYQDADGFTCRTIKDGWKNTDIKGNALTFENVSGALLKTQGFQGTICDITQKDSFPIVEYTKRLISGEKLKEVEIAETNKNNIEKSMGDLLKMLHPKDFEYIVDLIFQYSGWKKLTPGAGVEEFIDLDLLSPLTNERAVVQIKSTTSQQEYNDYEQKFYNHGTLYDRFFYVFHSPDKLNLKTNQKTKPIHILGIKEIATLIVELGLITILMKKVS